MRLFAGDIDELYRSALNYAGVSAGSSARQTIYSPYYPGGNSGMAAGFGGARFESDRDFAFGARFGGSGYYGGYSNYSSYGTGGDYGGPFGGWYPGPHSMRLGYGGGLGGCTQADYNLAAGRASIARRDTTLMQGYAFYDRGDYAQALPYFEQAFAKLPDNYGGIDAALMIGRTYIERAGDPADAPQAIYWLKKAGGTGLIYHRVRFNPADPYGAILPAAEASAMLGKIYLTGYGVPRDGKEAVKWFKRAANQRHVPALKILGDIYYNGYGVPRDTKAAKRYYEQAAKEGFAPAQYALGEIAYYGVDGRAPDLKQAVSWYNRASRVGDPDALYALAYAYDAGEGVAANSQMAVGLYKAAALKGSAEAQGAMGTYFYKGEIVPQDPAIARKWFEVAAIGGDVDAMFNLAAMLSKGEGGAKDMTKAYAWMSLAKAGGHDRAKQGVALLETRMDVNDRRAADALLRPRASN